jgi:class 3 adenylate cyclase
MHLSSQSGKQASEGERKQVTVLFADVAGFTSLSEELDPEEVQDLLKPCIEIMTQKINHFGGTVAQFMGDGIMALFGAPTAYEDSPQRAVHAALAIQEQLSSYSEELSQKGITLEMRIGLNTGLVVVGSMGSDQAVEFTAIGDTVNLASRMESSAEPGTVQVAESTYHLTEGYFDFEKLGEVEVKGRRKPVASYRPLRPLTTRTRVEASLPAGLSQFVGRTRELNHLTDCWELTKEGQGQVVGILGEPGVGKSRLILEFTLSLPAEDFTYLEGGCLHYGEAIAYLPILDILSNYFDISEGEDPKTIREKIAEKMSTFEGLVTILSPLYEVLSLPVDDEEYTELEPQVRRQKVFEAIRQLFISESQVKPLILAVEDLHWIDKTSEEFLTYLIDGLVANKILLILLYRPEYTAQWTSKSFYSTVRVDQLPKQTSEELVVSILSQGEVAPEIAELIVKKTAGNPLFIEELTQGLVENGSIVKDNGHYALSGKPSDIQVPDTIQGIIAARLDRLEENLKRIMQVASVIGREFAYRLLQAIMRMQEELKSSLQNLQSLEFIYEKSLFPELEYIFKHALTQEVAYNSLLLKKRKELHGKIGQAIEQLYSERSEEFYEMLAYHYAASDNADKALHYLKLSGDKAARSYSNWEAIAFYKEALQVLDSLPETEKRKREKIRIYLAILNPMLLLIYPEGSLGILEDAERLAKEVGDELSLATVYSKMALYHTVRGNASLGIEYSEKCFDMAEKTGAFDLIAERAVDICIAVYWSGDASKADDICRRALRLLEEQHRERDLYLQPGWTTFSALCGIGLIALGSMGEFSEAKAAFNRGYKNTIDGDDDMGAAFLRVSYSGQLYLKGDGHIAIDHGRKGIELMEGKQSSCSV